VPAKPQPSAVQLEEEALARIQAAVAERYAAAIAGPDVQVRFNNSTYDLYVGVQRADAGAYQEQSVLVLRQCSYRWVQSASKEALARIQAAVTECYAAVIAGPEVQVRSHQKLHAVCRCVQGRCKCVRGAECALFPHLLFNRGPVPSMCNTWLR
jgi:hypothetical protein